MIASYLRKAALISRAILLWRRLIAPFRNLNTPEHWRVIVQKGLKKILIISVCVGLLTAAAFAQRCGVERWSVKTGTDSGAAGVNLLNPQPANISDLIALAAPSPIPADSRFSPTEDTVFVVNATLTDYKLESGATGDSDYHLVLMDDQGNTMVVEIPSPSCVDPSSPFVGEITNARAEFDAQLSASSSFQTANIPVQVTGVGFFDFFHNQHGAAPNVIELHPVLDIQFNPSPAAEDFAVSTAATAMHLHANSSSALGVATLSAKGGSAPSVKFAVTGLPSGVTSQVNPGANGKMNLVLSAASNVPNGTFPITVTGSANGRSRSQTVALNLSNAPERDEVSQWEYKVITAASEQDVINQANKLGAQDWEMVSVVRVSVLPAWRAFFKRVMKD
jgi:hypothetical protein